MVSVYTVVGLKVVGVVKPLIRRVKTVSPKDNVWLMNLQCSSTVPHFAGDLMETLRQPLIYLFVWHNHVFAMQLI